MTRPPDERPQLHGLEQVSSTNDLAKHHPHDGRVHLFVAGTQTGGRGRGGNAWASPPGGLWFTILVPGEMVPLALTGWHYLLAADAVLAALPQAPLEVKWPNDLLLRGAKVGGILVELEWMGERLERLLVGVGLNTHLGREDLPTMAWPATTFRHEGFAVDHESFLRTFWAHVRRELLAGGEARWGVRERVNERLAWRGERVTLETPGGTVAGTLAGIAEEGALLLETRSGERTFTVVQGRGLRPSSTSPQDSNSTPAG